MKIFGVFLCLCGYLVNSNHLSDDHILYDEDPKLLKTLSDIPTHAPFSYHHEFLADNQEEYPFSYDKNHALGPQNWAKHYPICQGDNQSPINIKPHKCERVEFREPLKYPNSDKTPTKIVLENNGYSISWNFEYDGTRPYITGGPVGGNKYVLDNMHLHWGYQGEGGSEHLVDSQQADLEVHLLHRNIKYENFAEAVKHRDGLVVLGIPMIVSRNVGPRRMFKNIDDIRNPFTRVALEGHPKGYRIASDIAEFVANEWFLTYEGSLTTPPCSEATTWLISRWFRKIAYEDMKQIRRILGKDWTPVGPNNRPAVRNKNICEMFRIPTFL